MEIRQFARSYLHALQKADLQKLSALIVKSNNIVLSFASGFMPSALRLWYCTIVEGIKADFPRGMEQGHDMGLLISPLTFI